MECVGPWFKDRFKPFLWHITNLCYNITHRSRRRASMLMKIVIPWLSLLLMPLQSFVITGNVRDPTGRPVANIRVSLLDDNYQSIQTVFADTSGRFEFRGLRSGRF